MCGIVGYFLRQASEGLTQRMCDSVKHRGPDAAGFYHGERISLGIRRLAIIDRAGGAQPVYNENSTVVVVYNGEIYNHEVLRDQLEGKGHLFKSKVDTEILVHGFEEWGIEGLLERLNGMFAFALYDVGKNKLFLARDRLGIKPLYYTLQGGVLYFSSEIKAFLAVESISFQVNEEALPEYLALRYVPTPTTLFKGVLKLPAGHYMAIDGLGSHNIRRYWSFESVPLKLTDEEYIERFGELFCDAVKIRMMSEVPLGAYLSAGLDSNMVVWAMSQEISRPITTYSMGFGNKHDELIDARHSSSVFRTEHNEINFSQDSLNLLPKVIWHLDEPIGDAHTVPTYMLAQEAKKKLTVVLLGEGADESLYGYPFYKVAWMARSISRLLPKPIFNKLLPGMIQRCPLALLNRFFPFPASLGKEGRKQLHYFMRVISDGDGESVLRALSGLFIDDELKGLMLRPPTAAPRLSLGCYTNRNNDKAPDSLVRQIYTAHFSGWLQDFILLRHDKMSMAHSVECRVPFLDHRLVEFLAGAPRRLKISGWKDKIIERRFARKHLPKQIADRPKKPFFVPMEKFLDSESFQQLLHENLSKKRVEKRGYFNYEKVKELLNRSKQNDFLAAKRVTSLLILEIWHRVFIDREIRF